MPMDGLNSTLPNDTEALMALVRQQQIELQKHQAGQAEKEQKIQQLYKKLESKHGYIERLEERLRELLAKRFGASSERFNPDQFEFSLFNEAELIAEAEPDPEPDSDEAADAIDVPAHKRKRRPKASLPPELQRVDKRHELSEAERQCSCGCTMQPIGEDVHEQLSIIPRQYFVVRHIRTRYGCRCKARAQNAPIPVHPIPGAQVTPVMLAHIMVSKLLDGLPLYRQEKMAARDGVELPRAKLARWLIDGSCVFQPLLNRLEDTFFDYDIALSDDTRIQVLDRAAHSSKTQCALWIRRGGPPDKPVVLVDYASSKSGEAAYGLLSEFKGTLVCDGASNFNLSVRRNGLTVALCNDHARRRFRRVFDKLKKEDKQGALGSIAGQAIEQYKKLYAIETRIKPMTPEQKLAIRQNEAKPLWDTFIDWALQTQMQGVRHSGTTDALAYLLKHAEHLQTYCEDGRLPISNIKSEHVAKTIAVMRKNFLFSATEEGAKSSGRVFSLIETARANGHNPQHYLSVLLTELPAMDNFDDIDTLLPWAITPEEIAARYKAYPAP